MPINTVNDSFEALVARIAAGSDEAVWELLARYSKNIQRIVRRQMPTAIRNKVDSADIVQSVWRSLLRKHSTLDSITTVEQFAAYLVGMARLKVLETHRHFTQYQAFDVRREQSLEQPWSRSGASRAEISSPLGRRHDTPSAIVQAQEHWDRAMEKAGERGHRIVKLRLQGLTLDEIAVELGLGKSTVRRSLDALMESLDG